MDWISQSFCQQSTMLIIIYLTYEMIISFSLMSILNWTLLTHILFELLIEKTSDFTWRLNSQLRVKQTTDQLVPDWDRHLVQTLCQNLAYSKWRTACSAPPTYTSTGPQYLKEKKNFKARKLNHLEIVEVKYKKLAENG